MEKAQTPSDMAAAWSRWPARGVYRHYKGNLYLVLGVAMPIADTVPAHLQLGTARHSETGALCQVGILNNLLVARFPVTPTLPSIEALVVYVGLYDAGGAQMFVRPVDIWNERVTIKTAYKDDHQVARYEMVRSP